MPGQLSAEGTPAPGGNLRRQMQDVAVRTPFSKAILGLSGGPTDALVVHLGCQLAKPGGAELISVHVVEVDWRHELSEDIASGNERAAAVLDMADGICARYRVRSQTSLLQARDVGAALVDEAIEMGADAIVVGLPYRKRFGGDFAMGTTVPYVLHNAPCQVIVLREPVASSERRREAGDEQAQVAPPPSVAVQ
ncbi:MAG: universal stress protein [Chloroflexota bacterium]|nr:universal stress protein [Chloroflexota bacterium]